jgi:hypothetical protein
MNNEFNRAVVGICIIVILCCLFIAMKYENREGIVGSVTVKEIPLKLPVKEGSIRHKSFEEAVKNTN